MTYWTVLIITYHIEAHGFVEARTIFPSRYECGEAMDVMYEPVLKNYPNSFALCMPTETVSSTMIKPRPRP